MRRRPPENAVNSLFVVSLLVWQEVSSGRYRYCFSDELLDVSPSTICMVATVIYGRRLSSMGVRRTESYILILGRLCILTFCPIRFNSGVFIVVSRFHQIRR